MDGGMASGEGTMAGQLGSTIFALPPAHVVRNAFVKQYYNVLHQSPQDVHGFYTDASRLTRAETGPDGAVEFVISQSDIQLVLACLLSPSFLD